MSSTMTSTTVRADLAELGITKSDAARILDTTTRSLSTWTRDDDTPVPRAVSLALYGFRELHRYGLPWRADMKPIHAPTADLADFSERVARWRAEALDVDETLRRVKVRGGPAAPWQVHLDQGFALLGQMAMTFRVLKGGGFVPQSYDRADAPENLARDWPLLEDGIACVARELKRANLAVWRPLRLAPARKVVRDRILLWEDEPAPDTVVIVSRAELSLWLGDQASDAEAVAFMNAIRGALAEFVEKDERYFMGEFNELGVIEVELKGMDLMKGQMPLAMEAAAKNGTYPLPGGLK